MALLFAVLPDRGKWIIIPFALDANLVRLALSGTEAILHLFLAVVLFLLLSSRRTKSAGIVAALLAATRADGAVLVGLIALFYLLLRNDFANTIRENILAALIFLILYVPFFIVRWRYYEYPFPNTYYAKVQIPFDYNLYFGIKYLVNFLREYTVVLVVWLVGFALTLKGDSNSILRRFLLLISPALFVLYIIYVGGDTGSKDVRFFVPLIFLLYVSIGFDYQGRLAKIALAALCAFFVFQSAMMIKNNLEYMDKRFPGGYKAIALKFKEAIPHDKVLAVTAIGNIGYYSDLKILDLLGLADVEIAHNGLLTEKRFGKGHVKTG